jgi:hypothetical protein
LRITSRESCASIDAVGYRDDLEAAVERASALERELAHAKVDRERLNAELAAARAEIERKRAALNPADLESSPTKPRTPFGRFFALSMVALAVAALLLFWRFGRTADEPSCTLTTEPPGARLYAIYNANVNANASGLEHSLGQTPLSMSLERWRVDLFMNGRFFVRLAGYRDQDVQLPIGTMNARACNDRVVKLTPASE